MTIRTLIVDDEPLARQGLAMSLSRESDIEIVGQCGDGLQAIATIRQSSIDLIFLDIEMPGLDGLEVARLAKGEKAPLVVFVTAYDQYAVRAFDRAAVDYLVKPVSAARLGQALERVRLRLGERRGTVTLSMNSTATHGEMIGGIDTALIQWIEAEDYYIKLHTSSGSHLVRESIASLEQRLDAKTFRRVHRSAMVSRQAVDHLDDRGTESRVILRDQTALKVGRTYLAAVRDWLQS
jgi:two-component system LytT family response regulator